MLNTYAIKIDNTQDISRACFLCHDPSVWMIGDAITHEESILNKMKAKYPNVKDLVERFDLEVINISKH